jgi:hypothetical protein
MGVELPAHSPENCTDSPAGGAKSGAPDDLAAVLAAWPTLPAPIRAAVLALVRTAAAADRPAPP